MTNKQSFPVKLFRSLYDIGYYVEVLRQKTSKAVKYGILVALFFGSLSMIQPLVEWNRTIDQILVDMELHLPPFTITKGNLVSTSDVPYALNMEGLAIVVDPRGEVTPLQAEAGFGFYLTKNKMIVKNGINSGQNLYYQDFLKESFGKEDLKLLVSTMRFGGWLMIPIGALYGVLLLFLSASITMFYGRVVYAFSRKVISYRDSFVVAIYAQVLTGTVFLMTSIFLLDLPLLYPMCLILMGFYYLNLSRWDEKAHK